MTDTYKESGYFAIRSHFPEEVLDEMRPLITRFHHLWCQKNKEHLQNRAINSAYLTSPEYLNQSDRESLFRFIGSARLMEVVTSVMGNRVAFLNTQLFFDPVNRQQENYWHRDPQYHLSVIEQEQALSGPQVVHFRIPLVDEPGLELIPGTHRRWDSDEELKIRLEQNGHRNHEELSAGVRVPLNAGDLLVFNANMIHRGLYGMDRMALDILFCEPASEVLQFADVTCLPDPAILAGLEDGSAFRNTIDHMRSSQGS